VPDAVGFRETGTGSTMSFVLKPWQLLVMIVAGWINRQQQEVIEYLRTENQILKEAHPAQRRPAPTPGGQRQNPRPQGAR
jgi:hypothetical protein